VGGGEGEGDGEGTGGAGDGCGGGEGAEQPATSIISSRDRIRRSFIVCIITLLDTGDKAAFLWNRHCVINNAKAIIRCVFHCGSFSRRLIIFMITKGVVNEKEYRP